MREAEKASSKIHNRASAIFMQEKKLIYRLKFKSELGKKLFEIKICVRKFYLKSFFAHL